ncbi:MAG: DMT family transporter [Pseudomonadota bacterium]
MNWFLFIFASASWGGSFIAIRFMLDGMPPLAAAGSRTLLASGFMALFALVGRKPFPASKKWFPKLSALALVNFFIPWACLFWGEQFVEPAVASILNSTVPLFVFLFSIWLLSDEPPTWVRFSGVALGFLGIMMVFGPGLTHFSSDPRSTYGMVAVTIMSASYAIGAILTKRFGLGFDILWSISIQCFLAATGLLILSVVFEPTTWLQTVWMHPRSLWGMLYLSLVSTAIGWIIYFRLIKVWGALRSSATTYCMPLVAVILDWFFLDRIPSMLQIFGGTLILSSVGLIHLTRFPRLKLLSNRSTVRTDGAERDKTAGRDRDGEQERLGGDGEGERAPKGVRRSA